MDDLQAPSFSCGVLTQTPRLINYGETKLKILALHWPSVARNSRLLIGRSGEICAMVLLGFFPVAKLPPRLYFRGGYN